MSSLAWGTYVPSNATELFGSLAFILHLAGYTLYAKEVLVARIRPNVATWLMWLFGALVEFLTYDHITGSHWATSALPFACLIGVASICIAIGIAQWRNGEDVIYHKPTRGDYSLVGFDVVAAGVWLGGGGAALANVIAVSTSVVSFIPIWRTTLLQPNSERPLPWILWCFAYLAMTLSVATGSGSSEVSLYFYPLYYLALHSIVLALALKKEVS
jgi:hypothetical protein